MEIRIEFKRGEAATIIKNFALKEFPINTETHDVAVSENYGVWKVDIFPKEEEQTVEA